MNINNKLYRELRCSSCRKLICYEYVYAGRLAFHCPRCGEFNELNFKHLRTPEVQDKIKEFTHKIGEGVKKKNG